MPKRADDRSVQALKVVGFLIVAAAYTPLRGYFGNIGKFPHPERLALIALAYLALGLGWFVLLKRLSISREASLVSAIAFALIAGAGGTLAASFSTWVAILVWFGVAIAIALLLNRIPRDLGNFLAVSAIAILLVGLPLAWAGLDRAPNSVGESAGSTLPTNMRMHPDVFVVVLDGFPSERAVRDVYNAEIEFLPRVEITRTEAWSSYPMTIASVSSLLDMGYPLGDGDVVDGDSSRALSTIMSGQNRFTRFMDNHGYRITYVESGYSQSYCADVVDVCVASAFLDEGTHWILGQSIVGVELRRRTGSAFTQGALHTMEWMSANMSLIANNNRPDFVFANVLAPHPPLFLDSECGITYEDWRVGNSVFAGEEIVDERQAAFIAQSECVADFEDDILRNAPEGAVVIFVSDHGGDSRGQMSRADHNWDAEDIVERLSVHFATRGPIDCSFGGKVRLTEVLRDLLWCLAGAEPEKPLSDIAIFTASRIELTSDYRLERLTVEEMQSLRVQGE